MLQRDLRGTPIPFRRVLQIVLATLALAAPLTAQRPTRTPRWGASFGPAFHSMPSTGHLFPVGPLASGSFHRPVAARLELTLEGLAAYFPEHSDHIHAPCPTPEPCHEPVGPATLGAVIAGFHWADTAGANEPARTYLTIGAGLYRALQHPTVSGATRIGWTAGFGFILHRGPPRVALEIRYHQVARWPRDRMSLLPLTLAFAW